MVIFFIWIYTVTGSLLCCWGMLYVSPADQSLFFKMYKTVARKKTTAKNMNSLCVFSFLAYFVNKLRAVFIWPCILLSSSLVLVIPLDELAAI